MIDPSIPVPTSAFADLPDVSLGLLFVRVLLVIVFLGGMSFLAFYIARRRGIGFRARGKVLRGVVDRLPIGPKQALVVVEVADRYLLLGVTDHEVRELTELDLETVRRAMAEATKASGSAPRSSWRAIASAIRKEQK